MPSKTKIPAAPFQAPPLIPVEDDLSPLPEIYATGEATRADFVRDIALYQEIASEHREQAEAHRLKNDPRQFTKEKQAEVAQRTADALETALAEFNQANPPAEPEEASEPDTTPPASIEPAPPVPEPLPTHARHAVLPVMDDSRVVIQFCFSELWARPGEWRCDHPGCSSFETYCTLWLTDANHRALVRTIGTHRGAEAAKWVLETPGVGRAFCDDHLHDYLEPAARAGDRLITRYLLSSGGLAVIRQSHSRIFTHEEISFLSGEPCYMGDEWSEAVHLANLHRKVESLAARGQFAIEFDDEQGAPTEALLRQRAGEDIFSPDGLEWYFQTAYRHQARREALLAMAEAEIALIRENVARQIEPHDRELHSLNRRYREQVAAAVRRTVGHAGGELVFQHGSATYKPDSGVEIVVGPRGVNEPPVNLDSNEL